MAAEAKQDGIWETVKTVVYALLIAGIFRTLFFQPFYIPSSSMKGTLLIGDFLFVNKMAYGYAAVSCPWSLCPISGRIFGSEPERGDVVVFRHPTRNEDFIKRVIGLPGDRIQMRNGVLYINDEAATLEPVDPFREEFGTRATESNPANCSNPPVGNGGECLIDQFIETFPDGHEHLVLNIRDNGFGDNTPVFIVPEDQYFVMGDNRDNSSDSRFPRPNGVEFVPAENLIGRADRVIFSSAGDRIIYFWTWRSDRFFQAVE